MKKSLLALFLCMAANIYALEKFDIKLNTGNIGTGIHVPLASTLEIDLVNIGFEHKASGIGIEYSAIKFWNYLSGDESSKTSGRFSLLNFGIYWNILNLNRTPLLLALFSEVNYIHAAYKSGFSWDEFVFTGGLRFGFSGRFFANMHYNIFNIELGYRNINRNHTYYASVNLDMLVFFYIYLAAKSNLHH